MYHISWYFTLITFRFVSELQQEKQTHEILQPHTWLESQDMNDICGIFYHLMNVCMP